MGSGTKGNSTEQNVVYSFQAQNAIDKQDWGSASMWLGMIDDPFTSMMVQQNLNDAQQKYNNEQMAKQQADFDKQMADMKAQYDQRKEQQEAERKQQIEEYNKAQQEQQASAQQVTNAQQKADVSADSYLRADVKRNTGNLTAGHSSGALTAKKTLQGFGGGDEDLQAKEQWY